MYMGVLPFVLCVNGRRTWIATAGSSSLLARVGTQDCDWRRLLPKIENLCWGCGSEAFEGGSFSLHPENNLAL